MRTRNTELGDLLGEQYMKTKYKVVAQESAYMYQNLAWGHLVGILDKEELKRLQSKELLRNMVREKMDDFLKGLDEISQRHRWSYSIPDLDLREQIKQSTMKLLVPPYSEFLNTLLGCLARETLRAANRRAVGSDF
jgi:exocyst complex protein 7